MMSRREPVPKIQGKSIPGRRAAQAKALGEEGGSFCIPGPDGKLTPWQDLGRGGK